MIPGQLDWLGQSSVGRINAAQVTKNPMPTTSRMIGTIREKSEELITKKLPGAKSGKLLKRCQADYFCVAGAGVSESDPAGAVALISLMTASVMSFLLSLKTMIGVW